MMITTELSTTYVMMRIIAIIILFCLAGCRALQPITDPRIIDHPKNTYVIKNDLPSLNCVVDSRPQAVISWYKDGNLLMTQPEDPDSHIERVESGSLYFLKFYHNNKNPHGRYDVGIYYCNATNPETGVSVISRSARLDFAVIKDEFRENPQNRDVSLGGTTNMSCKPPRGDPEPRLRWLKDGFNLSATDRILVDEAGNLRVTHATPEDAGVYTCVAYNIAGERRSFPARLSLKEKPVLRRGPQNATVAEGRDVLLRCEATGDPEPSVRWEKVDGVLPPGRTNVLQDNSLEIQGARMDDAGTYKCTVANSVGVATANATLSVTSKPRFAAVPKNKMVIQNRRIRLRCDITGNPRPVIFWTRVSDQVSIFPNQVKGNFFLFENGFLTISPTRMEDSGEYTCTGISVSGNATAKVRLDVKDFNPPAPPIISMGPQNQTLPLESQAVMQCEAMGSPQPGISWLKDNSVLSLHDSRITIIDSGSLQISDLNHLDNGMYTCKADSETGEATRSARLQVEPASPEVIFHRPPEKRNFPAPPSGLTVSEVTDTSVKLSWQNNVTSGTTFTSSYMVEYFSPEDGEGWEVAAEEVTDVAEVIRDLKPATTYVFFVRARNTHGLSYPSQLTSPVKTKGDYQQWLLSTSMMAGKPPGSSGSSSGSSVSEDSAREKISGPTSLVYMHPVEVLSSTMVKISWELKKYQKYIEGFHIVYRQVEADVNDFQPHVVGRKSSSVSFALPLPMNVETITNPAATMCVLSNLEKFTRYHVTIQPFFRSTRGTESNGAHFLTGEDVPSSPPRNIKASYVNNNTVRLTWEQPARSQLNGIVHGYNIYILGNENHKDRELQVNATTRSFNISPLPREHSRKLQMSIFNKVGEGVRSQVIYIGHNPDITSSGLLGDRDGGSNLMAEPWFIGIVVSIVGAVLWVSLCVFSLYVYRRKKSAKKTLENQQNIINCKTNNVISDKTNQMPLLSNSTNSNGNCYRDSAGYDTKVARDQDAHLLGHTYQTLESLQDTTVGDSGFCSSGILSQQHQQQQMATEQLHQQQQIMRSANLDSLGQQQPSTTSVPGGAVVNKAGLPNIPNPAAYMIQHRHGSNSTTVSSGKSLSNKQLQNPPSTGTGAVTGSRPVDLNSSNGLPVHHQYAQPHRQYDQQQQQQSQYNGRSYNFQSSIDHLPELALTNSNFYSNSQLKNLPIEMMNQILIGDDGGGTYNPIDVSGPPHYPDNLWYPDLPTGSSQLGSLLHYGGLSDSTSPQSCLDCKNSTSYDSPCVGNLDSSFEGRPSLPASGMVQDMNRRMNLPLTDPKTLNYDLYPGALYSMTRDSASPSTYQRGGDIVHPASSSASLMNKNGKGRDWSTMNYMDRSIDLSEILPREVMRVSVPSQNSRVVTDSAYANGGDPYGAKSKKSKNSRQRAHRSASPCSTDSSYGPGLPYGKPKSQRKKHQQQSTGKLDQIEGGGPNLGKPRADDIIIGKGGHYGNVNNNNNNSTGSSKQQQQQHDAMFDNTDDSDVLKRANIISAFNIQDTPIV